MRYLRGYSIIGLVALFGAVAPWLLLTAVVAAAPVEQEASDPESNLPFLFGVYTVTWVAFFVYAFYMTRRQKDLNRDIRELRRALEDRQRQ